MKLFKAIAHQARVLHSKLREAGKERKRSPKWSSLRDRTLKAAPLCAACGDKQHLQVHHKKPFSDYPELELEPANLIVLCMGVNECHLRLGHGGNYRYFNPNVAQDTLDFQTYLEKRREIVVQARKARLDKPPGVEGADRHRARSAAPSTGITTSTNKAGGILKRLKTLFKPRKSAP